MKVFIKRILMSKYIVKLIGGYKILNPKRYNEIKKDMKPMLTIKIS